MFYRTTSLPHTSPEQTPWQLSVAWNSPSILAVAPWDFQVLFSSALTGVLASCSRFSQSNHISSFSFMLQLAGGGAFNSTPSPQKPACHCEDESQTTSNTIPALHSQLCIESPSFSLHCGTHSTKF